MYDYICGNLDNPELVQFKLFLDICFYTGRRGKEGLRELRVDSFQILENPTGRKYIIMVHNEVTKNKQGDESSSSKMHRTDNPPIIIEQEGNPRCPVSSFQKYLKHCHHDLHDKALFQHPKRGINANFDELWYDRAPVGEGKIGSWLKELSECAQCSQIYTNHCMRYTTANAMAKQGFPLAKIATVTGHCNYESLKSYLEAPDDKEKEQFCDALFEYAHAKNITNQGPPKNQQETVENNTSSEETQPQNIQVVAKAPNPEPELCSNIRGLSSANIWMSVHPKKIGP